MNEEFFFKTNPQKSANKVTINSYMMGSLFLVLSLIITLNPSQFSIAIMYQLVLAIPLLYVSSLAYSKIGYHTENIKYWDTLGWFTNTTGNLFVMNSIGLLTARFDPLLAHIYFYLFVILMIIYTFLNIKNNKGVLYQKLFKLFFLLLIIFFGGLLIL